MKKKLPLLICLAFSCTAYLNAQFNPLNSAQNGATNASNNAAENAGSNAVNNTLKGMFGSKKKDKKKDSAQTTSQPSKAPSQANSQPSGVSSDQGNGSSTPKAITYKAYSNYDFVPGDTIIFADDFASDQDGEFPAHWDLDAGQGLINKVDNFEAFSLTEGNYVLVSPRMKNPNYLTNTFTLEFDYLANEGYGPMLRFSCSNGNNADMHYETNGNVSSGYFAKDFSAPYPGDENSFRGKWHHAAFIYKNGQIKCYIDQYRILVMPNVAEVPVSVKFGGIGDMTNPVLFKDVRIASGGNMNTVHEKFTESKIVTHGINFDVDKATLKPESMGTLNMIIKVLTNNPDLKFEVDGHTDNSGNSQHNMELSQQRADAVKNQLISMGINSSRLTTKGFGDSKPISDNGTPEGKANNRRVEFVKI